MMCIEQHGFGVVAARWQLANANVDDDQRHSTLFLVPLLLGRLLEEMRPWEILSHLVSCCLALPLIDFVLHILSWLHLLLENLLI